jgi:hypothetical protein
MELICHDARIVQTAKNLLVTLLQNIFSFSEYMESMDLCGLVCAISFSRIFFKMVIVCKAYCMYQ